MKISARTARKTKRKKTKNGLNRKEEDIDFDKQFLDNDDDCFWLSSSSASSSSFFGEYELFSSLRLFVEDWLISWLSTLADTYLHLDNAAMKKKNSETDFQTVSDSENSMFSSDYTESYECRSKNSSNKDGNSEYSNSDGVDLDDFRAEEPLFWPSDSQSDWSSHETWDCFSMSPRKGLTSSDSRRISSLQFGSASSRLGNWRKVDEEMEEELSKCVYTDLLEDGEVSIERVMGLGEFDGHEGVEYEFNDYVFSMDDDL
ncbi:uncharacterized protein [Euphorbia lathyris]|uniref:uncharacterized protein n=1 Tax=Euphorbia lathyris TaxID=212925 RepID=UPI00331380B4